MTDAVAFDPPPLPASLPPPLPGPPALPGAGGPPPVPGLARFIGPEPAYWQLRIKGAALLLVTLGIYRFWLLTDVRRFLWSNTEIAGETLVGDLDIEVFQRRDVAEVLGGAIELCGHAFLRIP